MGAWLPVMDGPNADHSLPLLLTVNIYFLLHGNNEVSHRRWMLSVYIILCLSDSFEHPTLISQLIGGGEEAPQGEEFDFSEDALEVCRLDGFLILPPRPPSLKG